MNEQYIMETSEQVKQIKRSFRLFMNGVTAASMRSKGLNYKINWGVQLPDLKRMAAQYVTMQNWLLHCGLRMV